MQRESIVLRKSSFCVSSSEPLQTLDLLLLSSPPPALSALDTTASYLTAARNHKGSCPGKTELVTENALLRQQLIILRRQIKRAHCTKTDRMLLVLLARATRMWRQALMLVQPETLLKWYRQGFRLFWKQRSKAKSAKAKVAAETLALIKERASNNRLWGAERIRGELLKLDIRICKRTIQKYMRYVRTPRSRGQNWATFLRNHAGEIWACDFLQVTALFFCSLFAFFNTLAEIAESHPCRCGAISNRCLDSAATARGDSVWTNAEVPHSRP
jgi:hypothetical protein